MAGLGFEGTTGELFPFSGTSPPIATGSGLSWSTKETTRVVPAAQLRSWDHRERDTTIFLSCPQDLPGRQVTLGEGIRRATALKFPFPLHIGAPEKSKVGTVPFSMCCTSHGYSEGRPSYPTPGPPHNTAALHAPVGDITPWDGVGRQEKGGCGRRASPCSLSGQLLSEGGGWRKMFLLPCLLVTTGKQASNSWPLALLACWQAASTGKRREGESEGGSEADGAQPYLDGRFLVGLLGFFFFQSLPFSYFLLPLVGPCPFEPSPSREQTPPHQGNS